MSRLEEIYSAIYKDSTYNTSYLPKVKLCNDVESIPKVEDAGQVITVDGQRCQVMHNGVLIHEGSYHRQWMTDIIQYLRGHHEPQEERLFFEVLKYMAPQSVMVECGSFWSYYSLWFHKQVPKARNLMIEPNPYKCELGQLNFELNSYRGKFFNACIGAQYLAKCEFEDWDKAVYSIPQISIDWLMESEGLERIHLLHADIQSAEQALLDGSAQSLRNQRIDFIFLGTHSRNRPFLKYLESFGYRVLAAFEVEESFFDDGLILTCSPAIFSRVDPAAFKVSKRSSPLKRLIQKMGFGLAGTK